VRTASGILVVAGVLFIALAPAGSDVRASTSAVTLGNPPAATLAVTGARRLVLAVNILVTRSPMTLTAAVEQLAQDSGGTVGVALIDGAGLVLQRQRGVHRREHIQAGGADDGGAEHRGRQDEP